MIPLTYLCPPRREADINSSVISEDGLAGFLVELWVLTEVKNCDSVLFGVSESAMTTDISMARPKRKSSIRRDFIFLSVYVIGVCVYVLVCRRERPYTN